MDYIIPCENDLKIIICDKTIELYMKHNWTVHVRNNRGYLTRSFTENGKSRALHFHREVFGISDKRDLYVDHINGNTMDNRYSNLRVCTAQENSMNKRMRKGGGKLKGVYMNKSGRFQARIKHNNILINLGSYDTDTEAHAVYFAKAKELFGVFATSGKTCESCGNYL